MAVGNGGELREWRRSRGWDVPELARRLRRAADEPIAAHDGLVRMIRAWERGDHRPSERYELLYRRLGPPPANENEPESQPPASNQEDPEPVRRRTFVELTGISVVGAMLPGAAAISPAISIEPLVLMLTGTGPEPPMAPPDLTGLGLSVARARKDYQGCRYAELVSRLPRLLSQLDSACGCLGGDDRLRACALSADAYHVAAGFLLKIGDEGLAHVATDRSMTAALASQDPLTVGASGRIVTHTLMSSGHLAAAVTTAQNHAARLDHETGIKTPEWLSVHGPLLLRGALAAAQYDNRATAHEMLAEATSSASRLGSDANLRGTAFGPVDTQMHQVNVAVTLGDAGVGVPIVVLPFVNTALAGRAPFRRSVESLRAEGVKILLGPGGFQPHPPRTGDGQIDSYPWHLGLDEAERMLVPASPHP
jgi:hypothetical protein